MRRGSGGIDRDRSTHRRTAEVRSPFPCFARPPTHKTRNTNIKPHRLNDTIPQKRISLSTKLNPSSTPTASQNLLAAFLRLPDHLVSSAHFRPEALRKVRATRDEETRKIRKIDEDEKAEERRTMSDKAKKEERERKLAGMKPEEQKKFLERERKKDQERGQRRKTMRA